MHLLRKQFTLQSTVVKLFTSRVQIIVWIQITLLFTLLCPTPTSCTYISFLSPEKRKKCGTLRVVWANNISVMAILLYVDLMASFRKLTYLEKYVHLCSFRSALPRTDPRRAFLRHSQYGGLHLLGFPRPMSSGMPTCAG